MTNCQAWIIIVISVFALAANIGILYVIYSQFTGYRNELRHRTLLEIDQAAREIIGFGLKDPSLFKIFEKQVPHKMDKGNHFAHLWINHAYAVWHAHDGELISEEEWDPMKADIKLMFSAKIVKRNWQSYKKYYSKPFRKFIDS